MEDFVSRFIKGGQVLGIGSSELGEKFLKKIALHKEEKGLDLKVVPTSANITTIAAQLKLPLTSLNEHEIDLAVEFADLVDRDFNYIKRDSHSLVRDKMVAQSAETLIIVADEKAFAERLGGVIPFEITPFGYKRTIIQLENLGSTHLRKEGDRIMKTESGNYLVDVAVDEIHSLEDLEYQSKDIPGVLESGLFLGYADKVVLHNKKILVKSRLV